jgi:hypothetical protein
VLSISSEVLSSQLLSLQRKVMTGLAHQLSENLCRADDTIEKLNKDLKEAEQIVRQYEEIGSEHDIQLSPS